MFSVKNPILPPEHSKYNFQVFINFLEQKDYGKKSNPSVSFKYGHFHLIPRIEADGRITIDEKQLQALYVGIAPDLRARIYIIAHGRPGCNNLYNEHSIPISSKVLALFIKEKIFLGRSNKLVPEYYPPVISLLSCYAGEFTEVSYSLALINNSFAAHLSFDLNQQNINAIVQARTSKVVFCKGNKHFLTINPSHLARYKSIKEEIVSLNLRLKQLLKLSQKINLENNFNFRCVKDEFFLFQCEQRELAEKLREILYPHHEETVEIREKIKEIIRCLTEIRDRQKKMEQFFYPHHSLDSKVTYYNQGDFQKKYFSYDKESNPFLI